jgi:hypothetical protein
VAPTARRGKAAIEEDQLKGFKFFEPLQSLLERLHDDGTARDRAGNRDLFFDDYLLLLLLYFFNPAITSLRGLKKASELTKVQKSLGVKSTSLGSLSEAGTLFNPELLHEIVQELAAQAVDSELASATNGTKLTPQQRDELAGLTAVDGTFLKALPRMLWSLYRKDQHGRHQHATKMHLHFDVLNGVPLDAAVTPGATPETTQLKDMLQANRLYVADRGFVDYQLFANILKAHSSFIIRVKSNTAFEVAEERPLDPQAQAAGVTRDIVLSRLGTSHHRNYIQQPLRLVIVNADSPDGTNHTLWLLTDRLGMDADLIALAYRYRWTIELFFRWFKCVLGCRHLVAESENGVALQCYAALIASLLMVLWTGLQPDKRTWEMLQFYVMGWATLNELKAHIDESRAKAKGRLKATA